MNSATTAAKPQGLRSGALLRLGPTLLQRVPPLPPSHTALPLLLACLVGHFGLPGFDFHFISLNSPLVPAPLDREAALIYSHQQQKKNPVPQGVSCLGGDLKAEKEFQVEAWAFGLGNHSMALTHGPTEALVCHQLCKDPPVATRRLQTPLFPSCSPLCSELL